MSLDLAYAVLFVTAFAVLVAGIVRAVATYAGTPAPLKIPTTPAPTTRFGVMLRMARELVLFESLFKSNLWIWILGWVFHAALLVVLLRHLRYFVDAAPGWLVLVQPLGVLAGLAMTGALAGLWTRRIVVERVRYISTPSDHLMLVLLLAIAASGLAMKFVAHTDIVAVKHFFAGLLHLELQPLPRDPLLLLHLALVALLMLIFPFSKLLHAPGIFFSPTRNQADDPREKRHLAAWAARLDTQRR